jgi:hypothetical protein
VGTGRALYFLQKANAGFRIMAYGRGVMPISSDGATALVYSRREVLLSVSLANACDDTRCPLTKLLDALKPMFDSTAPVAIINDSESSVVSRIVPATDVHCRRDWRDRFGSYSDCRLGGELDGGVAIFPGDLFCDGVPEIDHFKCSSLSPAVRAISMSAGGRAISK